MIHKRKAASDDEVLVLNCIDSVEGILLDLQELQDQIAMGEGYALRVPEIGVLEDLQTAIFAVTRLMK